MDGVNLNASYDAGFVEQVQQESGQNMSLCYQCGNCTAGCPYTFVYDIPVSQIMRLVQAGQKRRVLECASLWLCATCESCTTRCPNEIDVARVMDVLRHMSRRQGFAARRPVKVFWDTFLESVRRHGRVFEAGLLASYVTKTGRVWTDMDLAPRILPKGKLKLKPHPIQGREEMEKIFKRFEARGGRS
ncbi:4Fe-4S dicluster domain-containing protein [Fundidesulfovibrio terrae]|uniref:4Fe-4S dicluster domain-containing protein n=1 Tax=Fundidesulfovibrio terrae TaxID=2922866 RepID=UPI001FAF3D68|nr:4Fe-4S dicluster domain-containing protein [Fundidesulfovibrio terrae]